jgi:hypothetical protein
MTNPYFPTRLFLLCSLFLLFACHKPGTSENIDCSDCIVKEVRQDGKLIEENEFNSAWQKTKTNYHINTEVKWAEKQVDYVYDNNGQLVKSVVSYPNWPTDNNWMEYTYNSQGRLTIVKTFKATGIINTDEYTYNGQTIICVSTGLYGSKQIGTYTLDSNGNILKLVRQAERNSTLEISYTEEWSDYDDKKNISGPFAGDVASKNNPRRHIYTPLAERPEQRTSAYSYNNAGYVVERIATFTYRNAQSTTKYQYKLIPKQ